MPSSKKSFIGNHSKLPIPNLLSVLVQKQLLQNRHLLLHVLQFLKITESDKRKKISQTKE
jgi:hypothetical protein